MLKVRQVEVAELRFEPGIQSQESLFLLPHHYL